MKGICCLLLLVTVLAVDAQKRLREDKPYIDSLDNVLSRELSREERATTLFLKGKYYQVLDSVKALAALAELVPLAEELGDQKLIADINFAKGQIFRYEDTSELSLRYFMKSMEVYQQIDDSLQQGLVYALVGQLYTNFFSDTDTSIQLVKKSLDIFTALNDQNRIAWCYYYIAINYRAASNYYQALDYFQKTYEIREAMGDTMRMAKANADMANVYFVMDELPKAINMYKQSIQVFASLEPTPSINLWLKSNNLNIGMALLSLEQYEEAYPYLKLADSLKNHARGKTNSNLIHAIGRYFFHTGKIDSAMNRYQDAVAMARRNKNYHVLPKLLRGVASVHQLRKQYSLALPNVNESIAIAKDANQPEHYSNGLKMLAEIYADMGRFKEAYAYNKEYHSLKDSLLNEDKIKSITTLENRYAFENEKKVLAQEQREKELVLQAKIDRNKLVQGGLIGGVSLFGIISFILFRFNRARKQANEKIQGQADELQVKNEQMLQLSNYKQGLAQMIAHDMKNPLNVIIALSERPEETESWQEVGQSGKLMLQMVNNMLDVQRFEETKMHLKTGVHHLFELATQAKYQVELLMMAKSIKFENLIETDHVVQADEDVLVRIFVNLYTNAIKYMPVGGTLTITSKEEEGRIHISVKDTGKGIPEDLQEHIFEKFWQSDPKKFGMSTSNGLGLTFCKMAVMAHGGKIGVRSKPGEGSTFFFDLEVSTHKVADVKPATHQDSNSNLTHEELDILKDLSKQLRKIPIYKSSKIEDVLKEGGTEHTPAIKQWKQKLREASFSFDNEAFEELTDFSG